MVEAVRKISLGRSLDNMRFLFPEEYGFHPKSWFLPQQFQEFADAVRSINSSIPHGHRHYQQHTATSFPSNDSVNAKKRPVYIVKPDEGSQGEGIYLIQDPKEYNFTSDKRHIVQEYISDPLLVDNLKFDLRVYVVLTSIDPLEVYVAKDGLARFCTMPYQPPNNRNIHTSFMHLTNYSLNKKSRNYLHTESENDGSKRSISSVFRQLRRMGDDINGIWTEIQAVIIKTLIAILPELKVEYQTEIPPHRSGPSCFQVPSHFWLAALPFLID